MSEHGADPVERFNGNLVGFAGAAYMAVEGLLTQHSPGLSVLVAPVQPDANGVYPQPQPGRKKTEY